MTSECNYLKVARSKFWNYWHSLSADERRRYNSTTMLKGWMARAQHEMEQKK